MKITASKTVAEVVAENYKAADVFKKHGIDFCCGGGVSLAEICRRKSIDYAHIEAELLALGNDIPESHDFNNWELDVLVDYIVEKHHTYVKENIPLIVQYAEKVARVHGHHYTETVKIRDLFNEVAKDLPVHLQKEEQILFPFIKMMVEAKRKGLPIPNPPFGTVQNPIRMMENEHDTSGEIFKEIAALSNQYQLPEGACNTFKVLYAKLKEFQDDLHQHIHLENNILFPKAVGMQV